MKSDVGFKHAEIDIRPSDITSPTSILNRYMTTTDQKLVVRKIQLIAFGFFAIPSVITILLEVLNMSGHPLTEWVSGEDMTTFQLNRGLIGTIATCVAYYAISVIATNKATSLLMAVMSTAMLAIGITRFTVFLFYTGEGWSNVASQLLYSAFYFVTMLLTFYMLGVLERNNPTALRTKRAALIIFWMGYIVPLFCVQAIKLLAAWSPIIMNIYFIVIEGVVLWGVYMLMTSEAFAGRTDNSPTPKGAYKVWNRYFKYFLWSLLGMAAVSILYLIVTEAILK